MQLRSGFIVVALAACGPAVHPVGPSATESADPATSVAKAATAPPSGGPPGRVPLGKSVVVGEMCPDGAAGRPGIAPMFVRGSEWKDDAADVEEPLTRNAIRQFAVLAEDGRRAGVFSVMGTADVGIGADVAIGSYVGGSPCASPGRADQPSVEDPACVAATRGCGLAIAPVVPGHDAFADTGPAEDDDAIMPETGAACVAGDTLVVDIDGDGSSETYSLPAFLDAVRAPAEEVTAVPTAAPPCQGSFAHWSARVDTGAEPGAAPAAIDPKYRVEIDVVGVADVDGDGRRELFVAFRYPDRRTIAVYSASATPARLELVAEAMPWQGTPQP